MRSAPATTVLDSLFFATPSAHHACARCFPTARWLAATSRSRSRSRRPRRSAASFRPMRPRRLRRKPTRRRSTSISCAQETDNVGYPILPLVHQLAKQCGEAGRYVHWGATTQDIMDTAVVLQLREGLRLVEARYRRRCAGSSPISHKRYRDTPMAGRTHLQQALPITFGYKTAIWLAMFDRHAERLAAVEATRPRRPVRRRGRHARLARRQRLRGSAGALRGARSRRSRSTWHVARDGFAEAVNFLALVTGSLGKVAIRHHDHGLDRIRRSL